MWDYIDHSKGVRCSLDVTGSHRRALGRKGTSPGSTLCSTDSSHQLRQPTGHLRCGGCKLRCASRIKYTLDFEDLEKNKKTISLIILY